MKNFVKIFQILLVLLLASCVSRKLDPTPVKPTPELSPTITATVTNMPPTLISRASETPSPTPTGTPDASLGRLAFVDIMDEEGDIAIDSVNTGGAILTRLTHDHMLIMNPAWSPDGKVIAFEACRGGSLGIDCPQGESFNIFTMGADGSNLTNLTRNAVNNRYPSWSPSGQIAFSSDRSGEDQIYVMDANGSGLKQITNGQTRNYEPHWSPDGKRLAYMCTQGSLFDAPDFAICILPADDSGEVTTINGTTPVWSPAQAEGGQHLAFHCFLNSHSDICVVNPDGSGLVNLTNSPVDEITPTWSPDGRWVAFQSNLNNDISIYKVCVSCKDNSELIRLTSGEGSANWPSWSPDGNQIAFLYDNDLYVMWADGSGQRLLARSILGLPVWQPNQEH